MIRQFCLSMFVGVISVGCGDNTSPPSSSPTPPSIPSKPAPEEEPLPTKWGRTPPTIGSPEGIPIVVQEISRASAALLKQASEGLYPIGQQMHSGKYPSDIRSKDGKPLLSLRVAILEFGEHETLFNQFKLDEPWDSETNKKLIPKMPKMYTPFRGTAKPGETFYQTFVGPRTAFAPRPEFGFHKISDGTSNTIAFVEAREPIIWTKPDVLIFDMAKDLPKLGAVAGEEFPVLMCDGRPLIIRKNFDPTEFKHLVTPDSFRNNERSADWKKVFTPGTD